MSQLDLNKHQKASYLAAIENSVGTKMFRTLYADRDERQVDILKNGEESCAFYVSSVLYLFRLIETKHATVDGTLRDLKNFGWEEIDTLEIGSVLVWESLVDDQGESHKHIGFFIGGNEAISNSKTKRGVVRHHVTFGVDSEEQSRKIIQIFQHPRLAS